MLAIKQTLYRTDAASPIVEALIDAAKSEKEVTAIVELRARQLTGLGKATRLKKLLQSPFTLLRRLLRLIDKEADQARRGEPARIIAKMNHLNEPVLIRALYRASRAGVHIDLLVRGVCSLRPGIPGVSENLRVRSIVGRFLEHSRVYYFHARGQELVYGACFGAAVECGDVFRRLRGRAATRAGGRTETTAG